MSRATRALLAAAAVALGAAAPAAAAGPQSFADLGSGDVAVTGTTASADVFLPLSPADVVAGGELVVRFDHSPLLRPDRSTLTLVAGGKPLTSVRLTRANADGGVVRATLPALPDARGGVLLEARFSMRLTRDACEDPRNAGLWARVRSSSTVAPELRAAPRNLATALATLVPLRRGAQVDLALGRAPSPAALEAAGTLAGALGRQAARVGEDPLVRAVPGVIPGHPTIAVGAGHVPGARPGAGEGALAVAATGAPKLSVGGDPAGLRRAAAALARRTLTPLPGRAAVVGTRLAPAAPGAALPWRRSAASFAQLGIGSREVTGEGTRTLELSVDRPPAWRVLDGAQLDLVVDAGAALSARTSSVTVAVGGREVGSRRLQPGDGPRHLRFGLDRGLVDTDLDGRAVRSLPVTLRFQLDVAQPACVPVPADAARAVVLDTSTVTLPHERTGARDLSRFPAPVAGPGAAARIVLPRQPSADELTAGLQLAAAVGRWADPATPLPLVTTSDRLRPEDRDASDLVVIGDAGRELGREVAAPGGARAAARQGLLVTAASPWGDGRDVLAVTGGDGEGLVRAARAVTRSDLVAKLAGGAMRVSPAAGAEAIAAGDPAAGPPAALAPVLAEPGRFEDVPVWALPSAVVLLAFLLIGGAVARRRWGGRTA